MTGGITVMHIAVVVDGSVIVVEVVVWVLVVVVTAATTTAAPDARRVRSRVNGLVIILL